MFYYDYCGSNFQPFFVMLKSAFKPYKSEYNFPCHVSLFAYATHLDFLCPPVCILSRVDNSFHLLLKDI